MDSNSKGFYLLTVFLKFNLKRNVRRAHGTNHTAVSDRARGASTCSSYLARERCAKKIERYILPALYLLSFHSVSSFY